MDRSAILDGMPDIDKGWWRPLEGEEVDADDRWSLVGMGGFLSTVLLLIVVLYSWVKLAGGVIDRQVFLMDAGFLGAIVFLATFYLSTVLERQREEIVLETQRKELLVDVMRHDLLRPAVDIISYINVLTHQEDVSDEELQKLERLAYVQKDVIDRASKYARLENRDALEMEETDIAAVLEDAVEAERERSPDVTFEVEAEEITAAANEEISHVFGGLLHAAADHASADTPVECGLSADGDDWTFTVGVEGVSIDAEDIDGIFDPYRSSAENPLDFGIARLVADLHGGDIRIDQENGKCSIVVRIPRQPG